MGSRSTHPTLGRHCTLTSPHRHTTSNVCVGLVGRGSKNSSDATCDLDLWGGRNKAASRLERNFCTDWDIKRRAPLRTTPEQRSGSSYVKSEATSANNETEAPTMSGQSSFQPASVEQHFKSSLAKTASRKIVSHLHSEETTQVYSKTAPQQTSHSDANATLHNMLTQSMCQMVAERKDQGSPQMTAEVIADSTSSQKEEVTVSAPSHGKFPFLHVKPERDASPGDDPSSQVTSQSSAQATTSDKSHERTTSARPSHANFFFLPVQTSASRGRRSMQHPSQSQTQL